MKLIVKYSEIFFLSRHLLGRVVLDLNKHIFPFAGMFYFWFMSD
jgi:hypothetical protein